MANDERPVGNQVAGPAMATGRPALEAAWNVGDAGAVLDLLADDAVIDLLPAARRLTARDDQRLLLHHFRPDLALGSTHIADDGMIDRLAVWLLPHRTASDEAALPVTATGAPVGSVPGAAGTSFLSGRPLARLLTILGALAVALPTVFVASTALLDTVYGLRPDWRPDGPPAANGITLSAVELEERRVVERDSQGNNVVGNLVSYDVEMVGYRGQRVPVRWAAFDARTRQRISLDAGDRSNTANRAAGDVVTEAANDRYSGHFWIPLPNQPQCVFIRVYVFEDDPQETRQDYLDSAPFDTHDAGDRICADDAAADTVMVPG